MKKIKTIEQRTRDAYDLRGVKYDGIQFSDYGLFYFLYFGYKFRKIDTQKTYSRSAFWDIFPKKAKDLIKREFEISDIVSTPSGFELI